MGWLGFTMRQEGLTSILNTRWAPLALKGFFPDKREIYNFKQAGAHQLMTDRQMLDSADIDGNYGLILHDKVLFEMVMSRYIKVPRNLAMVRGGRLIGLDPSSKSSEHVDLVALLEKHGALFSRPVDKCSGVGVTLFEHRDGQFTQDGRSLDRADLLLALLESGDIVLSERIGQSAFAQHLYTRTLNTTRVMTMLDPDTGEPFVAGAMQRIGNECSYPTDNASRSGFICNVDLETGRMSRALVITQRYRQVERHPESGVVFAEQVIPHWQDLCEELLDVTRRFPMLPYIAWDVALTDGGITLIEGNRWTDISPIQVFRPMLADRRIRRFLEHHALL